MKPSPAINAHANQIWGMFIFDRLTSGGSVIVYLAGTISWIDMQGEPIHVFGAGLKGMCCAPVRYLPNVRDHYRGRLVGRAGGRLALSTSLCWD